MRCYGFGPTGRRCYVIDEIKHLNRDCMRMLLGLLESLPSHVIVIGTTTSVTWADDVDGLFSRWRRFRLRKPSAQAIADHCERVAKSLSYRFPMVFGGFPTCKESTGRTWAETTSAPRSTYYRTRCVVVACERNRKSSRREANGETAC